MQLKLRPAINPLVGSHSTQPAPGRYTATQAWLEPPPTLAYPAWTGTLPLWRTGQFWRLIRHGAERVDLGRRVERQVGFTGVVIEFDAGNDPQEPGVDPFPFEVGERVAEHVMRQRVRDGGGERR